MRKELWKNSAFAIFSQFSSVTQSCPTLCDPMNCSMPGLPVHQHSWSSLKPMSIESVYSRADLLWGFVCAIDIVSVLQASNLSNIQFSSVAQSCPTLCNPTNRSTPGLTVHHQLLEFTQTHVHRVSDAIQTSHPLSSSSPPAPNPSQHQSLFQ